MRLFGVFACKTQWTQAWIALLRLQANRKALSCWSSLSLIFDDVSQVRKMASFSVFGFAARNEFIESASGSRNFSRSRFSDISSDARKARKKEPRQPHLPPLLLVSPLENPIKSIRNQVSSWLLHYINFSFSEDSRLLIRDGNSTARFYATISVTDFFGNSRHKSSKTNQNGFCWKWGFIDSASMGRWWLSSP